MAYLSCRQIKDKNIVMYFFIYQANKSTAITSYMVVFMFTLFIKIPVSKGNKLTERWS